MKRNFFIAGCTIGGHQWSSNTISHLHSLPETQKMMVIASETTEDEKKKSNGKMSRGYNYKGYFFCMKQAKVIPVNIYKNTRSTHWLWT